MSTDGPSIAQIPSLTLTFLDPTICVSQHAELFPTGTSVSTNPPSTLRIYVVIRETNFADGYLWGFGVYINSPDVWFGFAAMRFGLEWLHVYYTDDWRQFGGFIDNFNIAQIGVEWRPWIPDMFRQVPIVEHSTRNQSEQYVYDVLDWFQQLGLVSANASGQVKTRFRQYSDYVDTEAGSVQMPGSYPE
ncbi:hypothetical protein FSHL1_012068 [Fusarium sambucinum]